MAHILPTKFIQSQLPDTAAFNDENGGVEGVDPGNCILLMLVRNLDSGEGDRYAAAETAVTCTDTLQFWDCDVEFEGGAVAVSVVGFPFLVSHFGKSDDFTLELAVVCEYRFGWMISIKRVYAGCRLWLLVPDWAWL